MMKRQSIKFEFVSLFFISILSWHFADAQGYDNPLTLQGIDHTTLQSTSSRAMGGTTIGLKNDVTLMFSNPASLQSIKGIQTSFSGFQRYSSLSQNQQYAPLKYYSNFSLLMEGLTGYIGNPDSLHPGTNAGDTVQRPYDNIGPNWSRKNQNLNRFQMMLTIPFTIRDRRFTIGIGVTEYANLNHYYQNNNVLSPSIGSERPVPVPLPPNNPDSSFKTKWYQYMRSREGSINGFGGAISSSISENIDLGLSYMYLKGSSDDFEFRKSRGRLVFFYNYFRLDSVYGITTENGTSNYNGHEFNLSGIYHGRYISLGFSLKPPTTIKRSYSKQIQVDTSGVISLTNVEDKEEVRIPWRGMLGMAFNITKDLVLGLEYELRPFNSTVYKSNGIESKPWLSSYLFRAGVQYNPLEWLSLRAGLRNEAEVFEPEGNPMIGEPVTYSIYSAGFSIFYANIHFDLAYEYSLMKYQDMWQTNVNLNNEKCHNITFNITYEIPYNF